MRGAPRSTELIPFVFNLPIEFLPPWWREKEIEAELEKAARQKLLSLWRRKPTASQLLACRGAPDEVRSAAGRALFAVRGGKATAAKMREKGFPNLVKAREALKRKAQSENQEPRKR